MTTTGLEAFDLVIFDWAGTMVDFGCRAPIAALVEAFARRGVALQESAARVDMGKAKTDHVRALLARPEVRSAWTAATGAAPGEDDVGALMYELGPLMRVAAAEAAELVPGVVDTVAALRAAGIKIASSTGYTREMMEPVLVRAAEQGYAPDHLVCANETLHGRPSPLMIYKACLDLGAWPFSRVVKVDDAEAGIAEGRAAGCFTVGVSASGNEIGLSRPAFDALDADERERRLRMSSRRLKDAGADIVIQTVADLLPALIQASARHPAEDGAFEKA
jgi:phosphonoacetaldehyde hydrolase